MKTKVEYIEQSKCVTAKVSIESEELSEEEVRKRAEALYIEAQKFSNTMTMNKMRQQR